jgi:hypothetical protein
MRRGYVIDIEPDLRSMRRGDATRRGRSPSGRAIRASYLFLPEMRAVKRLACPGSIRWRESFLVLLARLSIPILLRLTPHHGRAFRISRTEVFLVNAVNFGLHGWVPCA